jgi:arylsulfatase A-like enzyme
LLTGLYLTQHRIENINGNRILNKDIVPLQTILNNNGYRTAGFSQNPLFSKIHNFDNFIEFHEINELLDKRLFTRYVRAMSENTEGIRGNAFRYLRKVIAPRILLKSVLDWILNSSHSQSFFLIANILNSHYAWSPDPDQLIRVIGLNPKYLINDDYYMLKPFDFNSNKRRITDEHRRLWKSYYDASIMQTDRAVGSFLKVLKQRGLLQNTIVIITSDHGEMLGESRDIVGHMLTLHDNILHIPLIIHHPNFKGGVVVENVVQLLDIFSTIIDWSRISTEGIPSHQLQRPTLSCSISHPEDCEGLAFAQEDYTDSYNVIKGLLNRNPDMDPNKYPRKQVAIRSATHKLITFDDRPEEFYNLEADPDEDDNIINTLSPIDQQIYFDLRNNLDTWSNSLVEFPPQEVESHINHQIEERLKSLGYI